jgi:hypothetical protein
MMRRIARMAALAVSLLLVLATPASAHEGEQAKAAIDDVRQAIAYIVNQPGNMDAIADKVNDALDSDDKDGVNMDLVSQAKAALEGNDMMQARLLLQASIGAVPDLSGTDVRPILHLAPNAGHVPLAVGDETGTNVVYDPLPGRRHLTGTDVVLLSIAAVLALAGLFLAWRWRPHDSIRALRRRLTSPKAA